VGRIHLKTLKTKIEDAEDPRFTGMRSDARDILIGSRLTGDCNLARCDPDFDCPGLEESGVSPDPKAISHRRSTTVQRPNQLALRFAAVLQLVPIFRTAPFKHRVGAMGRGFLHPSHLFVAGYDRQLHPFAVSLLFLLSAEPPESNTMQRPPYPSSESIFARGNWQTMIFTTLTFSQMAHAFALSRGVAFKQALARRRLPHHRSSACTALCCGLATSFQNHGFYLLLTLRPPPLLQP